MKDLKKTLQKLQIKSKELNEKIHIFFNSLNLNLKLDEFNAKKIFNIFIKAKENLSNETIKLIAGFDSISKIENLINFKNDL